MPNRTWKPLTILLVLAMVMSGIAALPFQLVGARDIGGESIQAVPVVNWTVPANGATGVNFDQQIKVVFDDSVTYDGNGTPFTNITQSTGTNPGGWAFQGWSTTDNVNDTAIWTHYEWMLVNEWITLDINVTDDEGLIEYNLSFRTKGVLQITGKVVDNQNNELSGITVNLNNTPEPFEMVTDATGEYDFLLDGNGDDGRGYYTITFTSAAWKEATVDITPLSFNSTGVASVEDKIMVKKEKITGVVKDLDSGANIDGVNVTIENNDNSDKWYTDTLSGSFSKSIEATNIDIIFQKDGYYGNSTTVTLIESEEKNIGTIYMEKIIPTPTITVWGIVTDTDNGDLLQGVEVAISGGDDKWISSLTDANGKYSMLAYAETFQVKAMKTGYETNLSAEWLDVPSDRTSVKRNIHLKIIPAEIYTLLGNVTDGMIGLGGATVKLYRNDGNYTNSTTTNTGGDYKIMYSPDAFTLVVSMNGFFTVVYPDEINSTHTNVSLANITLTKIGQDHKLRGYVEDNVENWISGADITIYDMNHTYSQTTTSNSEGYYEFIVHDEANYTLVVNADGYQSKAYKVQNITTDVTQDLLLIPSPTDVTKTTFTFVNWTHISVVEEWGLVVDNVSKRAELDRKYGMGDLGFTPNDWNLTQTEITAWKNYLLDKGLGQSDTLDFLTLNDQYFELGATFDVTIEQAGGVITAVNSTIFVNKSYTYNIVGDENTDPDTIVLNATYDGTYIDYVYNIILPSTPQYELTGNDTETTDVSVYGYNDPITIDPELGTGTVWVELSFEKSLGGDAVAKIDDGLFYVLNSTKEGYEVIVSAPQIGLNTNVTFTAKDSTDPVGDITLANYTWDFENDGTADAYGIEAEHNFSTGGDMTVNLTILDTGGNVTERLVTVHVDDEVPVAKLNVNDTFDNVTADATTITVEEDLELTFDGADSYDDLIDVDDKIGVIERWFWVWGDDTANSTVTMDEDNNVTHTYETPGTYTLEMTVTDVMGHESAAITRTVDVKDITAPTIPDFSLFNATMVAVNEGVENKLFYFGANATTDNDDFADLNFTWDIEFNGTSVIKTGNWTSYTFDNIGNYNVTLSAKDTSGNVQNFTKVINVAVGDRPDLRVEVTSWVFDTEVGTVGQEIKITVNITNIGVKAATGVWVTFYVRDSGGNDTELDGTLTLLDSNGTAITDEVIDAGEKVTASFVWKPSTKGTYTLWVQVGTPDEHSSQIVNNDNLGALEYSTITIKEAGWVIYAIIGGGIGILVLLYVGIKYFMGMRAGGDVKRGDKRKKK